MNIYIYIMMLIHTCTPFQSLLSLLLIIFSSTSFSGQKLDGRDFNGNSNHSRYLILLGRNLRPFGRWTFLDLQYMFSGMYNLRNLKLDIFLKVSSLKYMALMSHKFNIIPSTLSLPWKKKKKDQEKKIIVGKPYHITCKLLFSG